MEERKYLEKEELENHENNENYYSSSFKKNIKKNKAIIYVNKNFIGPKLINTMIHIKNLLQLKGIYEEDIEEIILQENDYNLINKIMLETNVTDFPIIYILNQPVGVIFFF